VSIPIARATSRRPCHVTFTVRFVLFPVVRTPSPGEAYSYAEASVPSRRHSWSDDALASSTSNLFVRAFLRYCGGSTRLVEGTNQGRIPSLKSSGLKRLSPFTVDPSGVPAFLM
jgi:hypothetical protein